MVRATISRPERPTLHVVVPVFNEEGNVARLIESFGAMVDEFADSHLVRFLVVDDGSRDGTAEAFARLGAALPLETLRHRHNLGPGKAFGTAFSHLAGKVGLDDFVATIEGDNTCRLELLRQMMRRAEEGFDVVLASPYLYGGGIRNTNLYRIALSNVANLIVKEALGLHGIVTMSSFFRLHRGAAFLRMQRVFGDAIIERSGFESMIEMLLKMTFMEYRISEVAMVLDTSQRVGKSKMKILRTGLGYLTLWKDKMRWLGLAESETKPPGQAHPAFASDGAATVTILGDGSGRTAPAVLAKPGSGNADGAKTPVEMR